MSENLESEQGLGQGEQTSMTPEQAKEVFVGSYNPEGQERATNLDLEGLRKEKEWLQGGIDDYQTQLDKGNEEGVHGSRIIKYTEVLPKLKKQLEALDVLIEDAEAKEK